MVEAHGLRKADRVVRPITAAGGRTCARPGCPAPARATLTFVYEAKRARLVALLPEVDPASYDLCIGHAERTSPPFGWELSDERPPEHDEGAVDLADEDRTVAVISAALRAVPALAPEPADRSEPAVARPVSQPSPAGEPDTAGAPRRREPRPVPAAVDAGAAVPDAGAAVSDDEVHALAAAAEVLAGAEVELALQELSDLDAVAAARPAGQPDAVTEDGPLTLALSLDLDDQAEDAEDAAEGDTHEPEGSDDPGDEFDDAPLSPDGHAQVW